MTCPGSELMDDSNETEACRFLGLSDGTVISQGPVPKFLCSESALNAIQLKMSIDFLDGVGENTSCDIFLTNTTIPYSFFTEIHK